MYTCAMCRIHGCNDGVEKGPKNCPSLTQDKKEAAEDYLNEGNHKIAEVSGRLSMDYSKTRLEETMDFARQCGYKKLGLAFCSALSEEARIVVKVFEANGFETESVICKVFGIPKDYIGIKNSSNTMCNPIGQAKLLNEARTDLNIVLGLCVGHDTLFFKYSDAPVTVLAVKDRVLAHNPLGAVYTAETFYRDKLYPSK